jgi:hypothetical protein
MGHIGDAHGRNRGTVKGREKDPAKRIPERISKPSFKRCDNELAIIARLILAFDFWCDHIN